MISASRLDSVFRIVCTTSLAGGALMLALSVAGCSDDSTGNGGGGGESAGGNAGIGGSGGADDAFASCAKGEIEPDFVEDAPLAGPGIDPKTGAVVAGDYFVATTYLALKPGQLESLFELSGPVIATLMTSQGLVAVGTAQSESCLAVRTLTVWQSAEDMVAFVTSTAHATAMAETSTLSRGTTNTISWAGDETTVSWQEAAVRLEAEASGDL